MIEGMGMGVVATTFIPRDEVIMRIPKVVISTEEKILKRNPEWSALLGHLKTTSIEGLFYARVKLGLDNFDNDVHKIYTEGEYYYLKNIQECWDGLQMDRDILQRLPPWSRIAIRKHQKVAQADWKMMTTLPLAKPKMVNGEMTVFGVTRAQYVDGICSRWSRAFTTDGLGSMVPLADNYNHAQDWNTLYTYDPEAREMVLKVTKDIEAGQQLFDNYGENYVHPSTQFLAYYGFTSPLSLASFFPNVTLGEVPMKFPTIRPDDPYRNIKLTVLQDHYNRVTDLSPYFYQPPITKALWLGHKHFRESDIGMVRFLLMEPSEMTSAEISRRLSKGLGSVPSMLFPPDASLFDPLSVEDRRVAEFLCESCLDSYRALRKIVDSNAFDNTSYPTFPFRKQFLTSSAVTLFNYHVSLVEVCLDTYFCGRT
jgi:hypothetical protein